MSKVYRLSNKLVVNLPFDVVKELGLKDGDEIEFFKYKDNSYIVAKKSDILAKVIGRGDGAQSNAEKAGNGADIILQQAEIEVLKKLDTLRYSDRTEDKVSSLLSSQEQKILKSLISKKVVSLFKKEGEATYKYSISKNIYDRFLFGKREKQGEKAVQQSKADEKAGEEPQAKAETKEAKKREEKAEEGVESENKSQWSESLDPKSYLDLLEKNGYVVISNQTEASALSEMLENSIRSGEIVGTRAFNKKYYIVMRSFINKNTGRVIKAMDKKATSVAEIAKSIGMEEEGVRSILYMLSEFGDVSEVKRDVFRIV
ncbi:MAG: AbrB/MazE/SpoVT family DNA-binding domain-containing protein [Candidatus Micrarchaeia archaeon]